jgi:Na+/proline symporter
MTPLLAAIGVYIAAQLAIGVWVSRRIRTEDDYLLAGRRLGYGLATFSLFATWFGAETCVSAAGQVYDEGLTLHTTEPYAYGVCFLIAGFAFAGPLWRRKLTTIADLFRERFSPGVERLAALLLIPTSVFWAGAQIRAFGHVLASASELESATAIAIAAGVVIVYTSFGGLLADAITDVVQGVALIVGLGILLSAVAGDLGGPSAAVERITEAGIALRPEGAGSWLATAEAWAVPILGSLVAQEMIARMSASRSAAVASRSTLAAGLGYVAIGSIPIALGLAARVLALDAGDSEQVLPQLALAHLSSLGYVLFAGALVSAILSTVDSTLLVASSLFSHNVVLPTRPRTSERSKVRLARAGVVAFGLAAFLLALASDSVAALVEAANAFGSAGALVALAFGLFTRFGGAASAYAALAAGTLAYVAAAGLNARAAPAVAFECPYLASLAAALAAYAAFAAAGKRAPQRS